MKRSAALVLLLAISFVSSCKLQRTNAYDLAGGANPLYDAPEVGAVVFSLEAGAYEGAQQVALTCPTGQAKIHYTTDGTEPSRAAGTLYESAIALYGDTIVKAMAYREDFPAASDTAAASRAYTLSNVVVPVVFTPEAGSYEGSKAVELSCATPQAKINYTTNGTDPSRTAGTLYASALTFTENTTLKAVAFRDDYPASTDTVVASRDYTIVYIGWRIASWSAAAGALGDPAVLGSHGFPQSLVFDSTGRLHVVVYAVTAQQWWYSSKAPSASTFSTPYSIFGTSVYTAAPPAVLAYSADNLFLAHTNRAAGQTFNLVFSQKPPASPWGTVETLYNFPIPSTSTLAAVASAPTFMFLFASDGAGKPRLFFSNGTDVFTAVRKQAGALVALPTTFVTGVSGYSMVAKGLDDAAMAYVDTAKTTVTYRTYKDSATQQVWTSPGASMVAGVVTILLDATGEPHIVFATYNPSATGDYSQFALHYYRRQAGVWVEAGTIAGSTTGGPAYNLLPSIVLTTDRKSIQHLHMLFTGCSGTADYRVRYAVYDNAAWQVRTEPLDATWNGIAPSVVADTAGNLHVVFSWSYLDNTRDLLYCVGTPAESQQ